ncbi:MAG: ComF family protein [Clostridia bacterium]|nr:ComF family protein [Clostridia bacterium]
MKEKKKSLVVRFMLFHKKLKKSVDHLIFPDDLKCIFCGNDIPNFDDQPFCEECEKTLPFNVGNRCIICDQPIKNEATVCDFCQREKKNFERLFSPFLYGAEVKNAILSYKESNRRYMAKAFAKIIVDYIHKEKPDLKLNFLSYIPLTSKKEKQRGFNQSKLLAEEIGKLLDVPVICLFEKIKDVGNQKELKFKQRRENVLGAYRLKDVKLKKTDRIMIVDDVVTTCATVGYCSGLVYPKVEKVYVCSLARETVENAKNQKKSVEVTYL